MIYDTFLYFNEEDLLEKRFETLKDVVDVFVVCQSTHTTTGHPKPIYFKRMRPNVVSLVNRKKPWGNTWHNERDQRDIAVPYLLRQSWSDIILHGDVDEIPDPDVVASLNVPSLPMTFRMVSYEGTEKCVTDRNWPGTVALTGALLNSIGSLDLVRSMRYQFNPIKNAGHHYSWFGGVDKILEKLDNHTHQELNLDSNRNRAELELALEEGRPFISNIKQRGEAFLPEVPTLCMKDELSELRRLAVGKRVVELGTWKGASAIAMAQGAEVVYTIDTHEGDIHTGKQSTWDEAKANIRKYNADNVYLLKGTTEHHLTRPPLPWFDMAFIDATHTYDAVYKDLSLVYPFICNNGLICCHDYETDGAGFGVTRAVDKFIAEGKIKKVRQVRSLIVCQKL